MRFFQGFLCALALLAAASSQPAEAYDVFATSFFTPEPGDPSPGLTGVLRIDTTTGVTTTFIPESATGLLQPTDIVFDDATNTLYVSSQNGRIWHYDATTGAPRLSFVPGEPAGVFALLPGAAFGDGVNSLLLGENNLLIAATAGGSIVPYRRQDGIQGVDFASGLPFPSGLAQAPDGAFLVSVGDPFGGPGAVQRVVPNGPMTTLIDFTDTPGVRGASNPTVVFAPTDFDTDGVVDDDDYDEWVDAYGSGSVADANGDGAVDALDYTLWRDSEGDEAKLVIADLNANRLQQFDLDGSNGETLAIIPPAIPTPLPPTANPAAPSNSPSEVLVTPEGTLLISTLGLTRRPDNRGALLEFDVDGNFLGAFATGLPPLSGIAFAPPVIGPPAVPEPGTAVLMMMACGIAPLRGRR
ncbi:MAG: hypothetical protein AAF266_06450 [Planctomycetota bacterium]